MSHQREVGSSSLSLFSILILVAKIAVECRTFWTPDHWGGPGIVIILH
jgi:hypothetical protein